jgi:hypothetical protein
VATRIHGANRLIGLNTEWLVDTVCVTSISIDKAGRWFGLHYVHRCADSVRFDKITESPVVRCSGHHFADIKHPVPKRIGIL